MDLSIQENIFESHDDDLFDRLPDEIVLVVFNKLHDAKALCLSMAVCKRFHRIAPQVDQIFLRIPQKKPRESDQEAQKGFFKTLVSKTLTKISQLIKSKSKNDDLNDSNLESFQVPTDALKVFDEMRKLHLRLPCYGYQKLGSKKGKSTPSTTFLKWKAGFGSELQSCVMLGAKNVVEKAENDEKMPDGSRIISQEELKLRIVWTISCLIAASARHYLIQETVRKHGRIENVVVSDESDQGRLCMNKKQVEEVREIKEKDDNLEYRSKIPALKMKMWYLERLELPGCGKVMEGATLVVIRPAGGGDGDVGLTEAEMVAGALGVEKEGNVVEEAVRKLMVAKKCYTLEMNSF